jgi:hypothetical protein
MHPDDPNWELNWLTGMNPEDCEIYDEFVDEPNEYETDPQYGSCYGHPY